MTTNDTRCDYKRHAMWLQTTRDVTTNDTRCDYKRHAMWLQTTHDVTTNDTRCDYKRHAMWLQRLHDVTTNNTRCDYKWHTMWLQTIHKVTQNTELNKTFLTFKILYDFTVHSLQKLHLRSQENYRLPCSDFHKNHNWWTQFHALAGADASYYSLR